MMTSDEFQAALVAMKVPRKAPDEILQELWDVKASLNRAAGYDVRRLAQNARRVTEQLVGPDGRVRAVTVEELTRLQRDF
jgi:hypothetical protein